MIIGICGIARSGKDTLGDFLNKHHGFVKVALADPMKRILMDLYQFSEAQLWGPSELRDIPDTRYVQRKASSLGKSQVGRNLKGTPFEKYQHLVDKYGCIPSPPEDEYLTPRFALQTLGDEFGRTCQKDTWVNYTLRIYQRLLKGGCYYDHVSGLRFCAEVSGVMESKKNVVVCDVRRWNEIEGLRNAGARLVRVVRPGAGLEGDAGNHGSEREQLDLDDEEFDEVINNDGSLEDLKAQLDKVMAKFHE